MRQRLFQFCCCLSSLFIAIVGFSTLSPARVEAQTSAVFTSLHSLADSVGEGDTPYAGLVQGSDGSFYGTCGYGGAQNLGTVFQVTPAGDYTVLYSFSGNGDGSHPFAGLTLGGDGNLYGTTDSSGLDAGTIFQITPDGTLTTLYAFATSGSNGSHPNGGLTLGKDGNLYGPTDKGGPANLGTIFRLSSTGVFTTLYSFTGAGGDGATPYGNLIQAADGNFYGVTYAGGSYGDGTVYRVTPTGAITILHSLNSAMGEGSGSEAGLIQDASGNFYGVTDNGGTFNKGTVFSVTPTGDVTVMHSFSGAQGDGATPFGGLTSGTDGNIYGTTGIGGSDGYGTLFKMTPSGALTVLHSLSGSGSEGAYVFSPLAQGTDGNFYGTAAAGGADGDGSIFRLSFSSHPSFFSGETSLDNGVFYVQFPNGNDFSYYGYLTDPHYIYHFDLGYEYVFDADDGQSGVYLYDFLTNGFFYTSPSFPFPYLYDFSQNSVVYYYADPNNPGRYDTDGIRYFYVFNTGRTISQPLNQVISLPISPLPFEPLIPLPGGH